jgi:hypothetical protein
MDDACMTPFRTQRLQGSLSAGARSRNHQAAGLTYFIERLIDTIDGNPQKSQ